MYVGMVVCMLYLVVVKRKSSFYLIVCCVPVHAMFATKNKFQIKIYRFN